MVKQYTLKIYPKGYGREVYRIIGICGSDSLDDLCYDILEAFDFSNEHMYEFCMSNKMYTEDNYQCDPDLGELLTSMSLDKLYLKKGQKFLFHYDFGDDWQFIIRVTNIDDIDVYHNSIIIKSKGHIEQYPCYDDDIF